MTIGAVQVKDAITVEGNASRDLVRIDSTVADRLFATLGAGDDTLNIKYTTIQFAALLDGGAGKDTLNRYKNNKNFTPSNFDYYQYMYL